MRKLQTFFCSGLPVSMMLDFFFPNLVKRLNLSELKYFTVRLFCRCMHVYDHVLAILVYDARGEEIEK